MVFRGEGKGILRRARASVAVTEGPGVSLLRSVPAPGRPCCRMQDGARERRPGGDGVQREGLRCGGRRRRGRVALRGARRASARRREVSRSENPSVAGVVSAAWVGRLRTWLWRGKSAARGLSADQKCMKLPPSWIEGVFWSVSPLLSGRAPAERASS